MLYLKLYRFFIVLKVLINQLNQTEMDNELTTEERCDLLLEECDQTMEELRVFFNLKVDENEKGRTDNN